MRDEQKFSAWLRGKLPGHVVRLENSIGAGMPDINWCYGGREVWIETKILRAGHAKLEREQYAWGMRRQVDGGRVMVVALDLDSDCVLTYAFPFSVIVMGKYLAIMSLPDTTFRRRDFHSSLLM